MNTEPRITQIKGKLFGIRFRPRGPGDSHIVIQIIKEDDDNWFCHGTSFSSHWIDDLIEQLQNAKMKLDNEAIKDRSGYGYEFKYEQ